MPHHLHWYSVLLILQVLSSVSERFLLLIRQVCEAIQQILVTARLPCINSPVLRHRQRPIHTHQSNAHTVADNHRSKAASVCRRLTGSEGLRTDQIPNCIADI
jgi:hypothetical protein